MSENTVLTVNKSVVGDKRGFAAIKLAYDYVWATDPDSKMSHVAFEGHAQMIGRGSVKMASGFTGEPKKSDDFNGGFKTLVGSWLNSDGNATPRAPRSQNTAAAGSKPADMTVTVKGDEITVAVDKSAVVLNVQSGQLTGDIMAARRALSVSIERLVTGATTIDGVVNEPVKTIYFCGSIEGSSESDVMAKCFAVMTGNDKNTKAAMIKVMAGGVKSRQTVNAAAGWLKVHLPAPAPAPATTAPAADAAKK